MKTKIIISTAILYILTILFSHKVDNTILVFSIIYSLFTLFLLYKTKNNFYYFRLSIITIIVIHLLFLILVIALVDWNKINFIGNLIVFYFILLILMIHHIFKVNNTLLKLLITLVLFLFIFICNKYYVQFLEQKLYFKTYFGEYNKSINTNKIKVLTNKGTITLDRLDKGILVLDFWNNGCGSCYKSFPLFNSFLNKYKSDKVSIYSINANSKEEDIKEAYEIMKDFELNFELIFIDKKYLKSFDVIKFPTVIVIKQNKIIFRGSIETLNNFSYKYLK